VRGVPFRVGQQPRWWGIQLHDPKPERVAVEFAQRQSEREPIYLAKHEPQRVAERITVVFAVNESKRVTERKPVVLSQHEPEREAERLALTESKLEPISISVKQPERLAELLAHCCRLRQQCEGR
jgi:hypothetical protein